VLANRHQKTRVKIVEHGTSERNTGNVHKHRSLCPLVSIRVICILVAFTPCVSNMARQRIGIVRFDALAIAVVGISLPVVIVVVVVAAAAAIATVVVSTAAIIVSTVVIPVTASGVVRVGVGVRIAAGVVVPVPTRVPLTLFALLTLPDPGEVLGYVHQEFLGDAEVGFIELLTISFRMGSDEVPLSVLGVKERGFGRSG